MISSRRIVNFVGTFILVLLSVRTTNADSPCGKTTAASDTEHKAKEKSENDSTMILVVVGLLILTVLTIWLFKVKRFRFFHETGVCMFYGIIAGLVIRYTGGRKTKGYPITIDCDYAPKTLWLTANLSKYSYDLTGPLHTVATQESGELETKAVFDPEVFFYALLPPIIFFAGYDMKKRFFFRNLGAILTFAFIGTTLSCVVFGGMMYGFVSMFTGSKYEGFTFQKSLLFGSLISATDPVTVLAIFHDLHVDVDLYAIVFGESVMNDAVAIVLYRSIQEYESEHFNALSILKAVGEFIGIFGGSFLLGSFMGLLNALLTKLTRIGQFPQLETALFTLMSYSTFLIAESCSLTGGSFCCKYATDLCIYGNYASDNVCCILAVFQVLLSVTGIVAVLFCGISQAHYTYNNLSKQSQVATKEVFGLLNFLAESFIFSYMGLTVFTFEEHQWDPSFIAWVFLGIAVSRFLNIYPLSFILNLGRKKKIPWNFQHMLFFAGLRGAVAFALAIRNTEGKVHQLMLTAVLIIAIVTVVFNGGFTTQALLKLGIRVNVDPDEDIRTEIRRDEDGNEIEEISYDKSWLVQKWYEFDVKYMKPLFTQRGGDFSAESLPSCCSPLASCITRKHRRFENEDVYERPKANMDDICSVDDEMIDIAMTKPPSRSVSKEEHVPENVSSRSNRTESNTDTTFNTASEPKSTSVELQVVS